MALDRFPPPWTVEEKFACFVVRDANGQALAYIYFAKGKPGRASGAKLLSKDEAQRIAANIAKTAATVTGHKITRPPLLRLAPSEVNASVPTICTPMDSILPQRRWREEKSAHAEASAIPKRG
jgi:hypothetical protein